MHVPRCRWQGEPSQVLPLQFEQVNEKPSPRPNQGGQRGEGAVCGPKVVLVAGELGQVRGDTIWWENRWSGGVSKGSSYLLLLLLWHSIA